MKLDFGTLAFGYHIAGGGGTPNWSTSLGQGAGYKINDYPQMNELLKGLIYSSVALSRVTSKIGKGGRVVSGDSDTSSIMVASFFDKVFVNDIQIIEGKYTLLITKDTAKSHEGRLKLKYGPSNTCSVEENFTNNQFWEKAKKQLNLNNDACFFVFDISVRNQDELVLKTIFVDKDKSVQYEDMKSLHRAWDDLIAREGYEEEVQTSANNTPTVEARKYVSENFACNRIIFGAPGTGKSFRINNERKDLLGNIGEYERVTFHPDYSYAQFVGTYKPTMVENVKFNTKTDEEKYISNILCDKSKSAQEKYDLLFDLFSTCKERGVTRLPILVNLSNDDTFHTRKVDGDGAANDNSTERSHGKALRPFVNLISGDEKSSEISYEYVPGPFMRTLVKSLKSPQQPYLLIIEEINRANVAAVFGDVFQLLDRDDDENSEYPIQTTEDMRKYFAKELGGSPSDYSEMKIPSNMFIWATMNSADQGVFPMDTAFKRRWDFTYIGVDSNDDGINGKTVTLGKEDYECKVEWNTLRKAINSALLSYKINEDKLLGPYFISKKVLGEGDEINADEFIRVFKNKVLMYLFEDAARQKRPSLFAGCDEKNLYSSICEEFDEKGVFIFDKAISNEFEKAKNQAESQEETLEQNQQGDRE